jgi:hypothetical protein
LAGKSAEQMEQQRKIMGSRTCALHKANWSSFHPPNEIPILQYAHLCNPDLLA